MVDDLRMEDRPIRNPDHALREADRGWTVLVNLDNAASVALNETGMLLWRAVDGSATVGEIIGAARGHFEDTPAGAGDDMLAVLETLHAAGLIGFEVKT
ncbi:PqqD family protein [bacterium]|nr:PqqD family protein [bacterium]